MRFLVLVVLSTSPAMAAPLDASGCPAGTTFHTQTVVNPPEELATESMTYVDHECLLPDGKRHGPYERYVHGNKTTPFHRGAYDHGKRTGRWVVARSHEGTYVADVQDGEWKKTYANGKLAWRVKYVKGLAQGPYEQRYESGGKQLTGTMTDNQRDGAWTFYKPDGSVERVEKWTRGTLVK
jgi:hypothetical protein